MSYVALVRALVLVPVVTLLTACGASTSEEPRAEQSAPAVAQEPVAAAAPAVVRDAVQEADGSWVAGLPVSTGENVSLAVALADPESFADRSVRTTATIEQVCQVSGCWMIVTDGESRTRVTFADYGFFVPKHVAGATVEMDVRIDRTVMDEETARHLASETEGEDPSAITGPVETVAVVATGVRIREKSE